MSVSLGILFGILAMLGWGIADFLVAIAVRKENAVSVLLWTQTISLIIAGIAYVFFFTFPPLSLSTIVITFLCAGLSVLSWAAYYKGLQIGKVSIVSPIADCWPIITVFLGLAFLGESMSALQATGAALAILGAVLASFKLHDLLRLKNPAQGVPYALIGLIGWGIQFFLIAILVQRVGWFFSLFLVKMASVFFLAVYVAVDKRDFAFPRTAWFVVILIGVFEMFASFAYGYGITLEYTAIIAPIIASVPLVIVLLARIFFKERVEWNQGIGIAAILSGLVLLAL